MGRIAKAPGAGDVRPDFTESIVEDAALALGQVRLIGYPAPGPARPAPTLACGRLEVTA